MKTILIKGGRLIDPSQGIDKTMDLVLRGGRVDAVGGACAGADLVIDAAGKIVCPGLVDMHVHLREPGNEEAETIASGTAAAVASGITSVACMPNTIPAVDTQGAVAFILLQAERAGHANVFPIGAVTKGREGKELAEIGQLVQGGAVALSDDGSSVANAEIMRRALEYTQMFNRAIISHCEDRSLAGDGIMHEGFVSTVLGLPGLPAAAEDVMVARDVTLAEMTGGKLHIAHVSSGNSVDILRRARQRGVEVTAEVTPHHLALTDERMRTFDSNFKMNPPLRSQDHVDGLLEGLRDGTIDCIATDHAPHAVERKVAELDAAPFGATGMETMLPVLVRVLIEPEVLTWPQLIEKLTVSPAAVLGIPKGTLRVGADADVTIIDPDATWTIDPARFRSRSRNCPFAGWEVRGRAEATIVGGVLKYSGGELR